VVVVRKQEDAEAPAPASRFTLSLSHQLAQGRPRRGSSMSAEEVAEDNQASTGPDIDFSKKHQLEHTWCAVRQPAAVRARWWC